MLRRFAHNAVLGAVLATSAGVISAPTPAHATTLAPLSIEQLTDASTHIVLGTVVESWAQLDERGVPWTFALVEVKDHLKGPALPEQFMVETPGGFVNGAYHDVPSAARFSTGEEVFLFAAAIRRGTSLSPTGWTMGKYSVRRAPGDEEPYLTTWVDHNSSLAFDHRFIPHPPQERRVYLSDMVERVEKRLASGWDGVHIPGISDEDLAEINTPERRHVR